MAELFLLALLYVRVIASDGAWHWQIFRRYGRVFGRSLFGLSRRAFWEESVAGSDESDAVGESPSSVRIFKIAKKGLDYSLRHSEESKRHSFPFDNNKWPRFRLYFLVFYHTDRISTFRLLVDECELNVPFFASLKRTEYNH